MDPSTSRSRPRSRIMIDNAFHSANTASSYNLSEIWPFPIDGVGESTSAAADGGGGLDLRRQQFGSTLDHCGEANFNRHVCGRAGVGGARRRREPVGVEDEAAKGASTSGGGNDYGNATANGKNDSDGKRVKGSGFREESHQQHQSSKADVGRGAAQQNNKPEPPKDYIHVRARRGQATDSHSLAERARREKISERMRILQDLVPGCNKVIGKALILDEIINYIQSLQRQVEFLSMKLEAANSRMNIGVEGYPSKDFGQQAFGTSGVRYGSEAPRDYGRGSSPEWLHMQIGGGFERQP